MSDDTVIANCCGACFGICFLTCCQSVLIALNFKKPGSSAGSTQRGCCRNLGEATEDDAFEENARRRRLAHPSQQHRNGKENGAGGDGAVTEQPAASPEMAATKSNADTNTTATKPDTDEAK